MFLKVSASIILAVGLMSGCKNQEKFSIQAHGDKLCDLPSADGGQIFEPDYGIFAELVLQDDKWLTFIDGQAKESVQEEHKIAEFSKRFRDHSEAMGCVPKVLISSDFDAAFSEHRSAIRAFAASGVSHFYFHLKSSKPDAVEVVPLVLSYPHQSMEHEPLLIRIDGDDSIHIQEEAFSRKSNDGNPGPWMEKMDECLRLYSQAASANGLSRLVYLEVSQNASWQSVIDALVGLHRHGLQPYFVLSEADSP